MRALAIHEMNVICGGNGEPFGAQGTREFNACMADNWGQNVVVGATIGAFTGGIGGAILGAVGGSTGTAIYCGLKAVF